MPFVGMDWRGPGEEWVKGEGCEWVRMRGVRRKVLSNLHETTFCRDHLNTDPSVKRPQVYIIFKKNNILHPLGEALNDLEMEESVRDQRRFAYVSSLAGELVREKMATMSGTAQRSLLRILHAIVLHCVSTNTYNRLARDLLNDLEVTLVNCHHDHVGSGILWMEHWKHLEALRGIVEEADRKLMDSDHELNDEDDDSVKLQDLPPEMLHLILLRLPDHTDLTSAIRSLSSSPSSFSPLSASPQHSSFLSASSTSFLSESLPPTSHFPSLAALPLAHDSSLQADEHLFNHHPVRHNNTLNNNNNNINNKARSTQPIQIPYARSNTMPHQACSLPSQPPPDQPDPAEEMYFKRLVLRSFPESGKWKEVMGREGFKSWTRLYQRLCKRFKKPCSYSNCVVLCKHCSALFWKLEGHPCHLHKHQPSCTPVSPESFASLFATV